MQTLKIEIPSGHQVDFNKSTGVITVKESPKDVTERIKSIEDILADHGLTRGQFDEQR